MMPQAILFGSIGTLVETSELQRRAFNEAFREAGLDWHWDRAPYQSMLASSGGRERVLAYADERGQSVDVDALHARKTVLFGEAMRRGLSLRPGVRDVMVWARQQDVKLGIASTTSRANLDAALDAVGVARDAFAFVGDGSMVERGKPDPAIYHLVVERLGVEPAGAVAVEDSAVSLRSAVAAGIPTIAFPGANTMSQDFQAARAVVDELDSSIIETVLDG